jgi:hypothetical protein
MRRSEIHDQFKTFCEFLLRRRGYEIIHGSKLSPGTAGQAQDVDFIVKRGTAGNRFVVEAKLYRSRNVDRTTLSNAILSLRKHMRLHGCPRGLLIAPVNMPSNLTTDKKIKIWGLKELQEKSALVGVSSVFDRFLEHAASERSSDVTLSQMIDSLNNQFGSVFGESTPARESFSEIVAEQAQNLGANILAELNDSVSGRGAAAVTFENICTNALKYLFDEDFEGWHPQNRVEDGFHINDLVARLCSQNDVWMWIGHDFKSRYVVFEFKNYTEEISQNQIYSTEKYLYGGALRTVAVIVARNGCDTLAQRAVKAALREHGKLMIWLTIEDLKDMLRFKIEGDDYMDVISTRVDEIMTDLAP